MYIFCERISNLLLKKKKKKKRTSTQQKTKKKKIKWKNFLKKNFIYFVINNRIFKIYLYFF